MIRSLFAAAVLGICLSGGLHMTDPRSLQCGQPARRYGDTAAQERMGETAAGIGAETEAEVTDAGLELEKRTDAKLPGDAGRFRIRYSAGRGHKGAAIRSYDVSGEGRIAIAFSDERIGVYDRDMNCLFELFFEETGAYGVLWKGENVLFLDHRSNTAMEYNDRGELMNVYRIKGPSNHWFEIVEERMRSCGEDVYLCTNRYGSDNRNVRYGSYTILKRYGPSGEEIIYRADARIDGGLWGALVIGGFALAAGAVLWMIVSGWRRRSS